MSELEGLRARDIMTRDPECLPLDCTLAEAARFLTDRELSGAPVLGRSGETLSVLSTSDLLRVLAEELLQEGEPEPGRVSALRRREVSQVLERLTISCDEDTPIAELCALMARHRVHRVVVVGDDQPVGIITSLDVARTLAESLGAVVATPEPLGRE